MGNEPLVSILMPTYNRAHLLPNSIGSVLKQDYTNWELIVWDDGSTDNTPEVVRSLADGRVTYFQQPNSGKSHALNRALETAEGQYIAFLDDDDQWTERKLSTQVGVLERFRYIDLLFANFANVNLSTGVEGLCFDQNAIGLRSLSTEEIAARVFVIHHGVPEGLLRSNFINFDTVIVRQKVLRDAGGFNEQLRNSEDLELLWRMGLAGVRFGYVDDVLAKRIKYPGSLSSPSTVMYQNHIKCLDLCLSHTSTNHRDDLVPVINDAYHRAWLGMIRQYGLLNDKPNAAKAFIQALRCGHSWVAYYGIFGALAGPRASDTLRGLVRRMKRVLQPK